MDVQRKAPSGKKSSGTKYNFANEKRNYVSFYFWQTILLEQHMKFDVVLAGCLKSILEPQYEIALGQFLEGKSEKKGRSRIRVKVPLRDSIIEMSL
jgi:hypothetical protein